MVCLSRAAAAAAVDETIDAGRAELPRLPLLLMLLCVWEIADEGRDPDDADLGRRGAAYGCVKTFFPTNFLGPAALATTFVDPLLKVFLFPSVPLPLMVVFF